MNTIKQVEIRGLFHQYHLKWDLHDDVNVLVGINGSGKSTILRSVDALLSEKHIFLKGMKIDVEVSFSDHTGMAYYGSSGLKRDAPAPVKHAYITTFDVPLKDKRAIGQHETPLDKELQRVIYTIGNRQKSFSNYRLKATNFPEQAESINRRIEMLFGSIDRLFAETGKKIEIDRENNSLGFRMGESLIPLDKISTGEKQLLIIIFTVFLMEEAPYVLLMDEPEISLHIGWQQQLIDIIRQLNPNSQLIIATHSPSIFGDGWGNKIFFTDDLIQ
ncbi:MAG: ATP-binding protein [Bacteroidales bacterium]|jgi:predicted ATP-binding protein involved in virulence|nr:ATP-binding protein [Bacteroidales bacterium]